MVFLCEYMYVKQSVMVNACKVIWGESKHAILFTLLVVVIGNNKTQNWEVN